MLVVDDDECIRESLVELLEDAGHQTVATSNGQEALQFLRSNGRPCLILLDLMMPVMDGATFRTQQLSDPALSAIPVALITAAGPQRTATVHADAVLPKPLSIERLLAVVAHFCPGHSRHKNDMTGFATRMHVTSSLSINETALERLPEVSDAGKRDRAQDALLAAREAREADD